MTEETQNYVTSIQEVDLKRRRIYVNYEPAFVLYISELKRFGIRKMHIYLLLIMRRLLIY